MIPTSSQGQGLFDVLGIDIAQHVCGTLGVKDLLRLALVNRETRSFIRSDTFDHAWRRTLRRPDLLGGKGNAASLELNIGWHLYALLCERSSSIRNHRRISDSIDRMLIGMRTYPRMLQDGMDALRSMR